MLHWEGSSLLQSSSLGGLREFRCLIHVADKAHRWISMAAHKVRRLDLDLDATKVTLAASEGEFAATQAVTAVA